MTHKDNTYTEERLGPWKDRFARQLAEIQYIFENAPPATMNASQWALELQRLTSELDTTAGVMLDELRAFYN